MSDEVLTSARKMTNPGASKAAISFHYDLGNEFFKLFLDRELCYSCAMYHDESDSLELAQEQKLEFHIQQARASGVNRVLDIGCGWGALQRRLVNIHKVRTAVGLTLSDNQADWIRTMGLPGVEVRLESWSDHVPNAVYDSIISIGAFEHFARPCDRDSRVAGYRDFFLRCYGWLKPSGWMSLQTIGLGAVDRGTEGQFVSENIFPESDLPRLGEIADAAEGIFEIVSVRNDRADYKRTNHEFRARLRKNWDEAVALVGEETVRRFDKYFRISAAGFSFGTTNLYRLSLRRLAHPLFGIAL
ncbi:MAG TPA: cyclopropane-fatty-acyl-phospholipid synthase family protein [Candidatus Binataceae bacterium]|nr:cyclopropane-fatty-acyl-phospholipid synthase family protein [Candidatus Binataceae bacterium]